VSETLCPAKPWLARRLCVRRRATVRHTRGVAPPDTQIHPPLPKPDAVSQFFWDGCAQHKLLIQRCSQCYRYNHPPRIVCPSCLSTSLVPTPVSGMAVVDTFTVPLQPYDAYYAAQVPYALAVVELAEQRFLKMVTNIVDIDPDLVRIGMPVEVEFRPVGGGVTLPLFRARET
jgi:uncharacterized protein